MSASTWSPRPTRRTTRPSPRPAIVELGKLKGNEGDQNYEIPADTDLAKYRAVTIWCRRFSVNFATAPLTPVS